MRYYGIVTHEGEQTLVEFPDAPGCQTFADRGEDIHALAQEALEGWIEAHLAHGEAPPARSGKRPRAPKGGTVIEVPVSPALGARLALRWARQEMGLSQAALAELVGVSRQQISALESPDANLRLDTLERVAAAMGLHVHVDLAPVP
jgi:predicted RNase H-like HicB family nuclease/DNA-binding XRE family transcriptional regulator